MSVRASYAAEVYLCMYNVVEAEAYIFYLFFWCCSSAFKPPLQHPTPVVCQWCGFRCSRRADIEVEFLAATVENESNNGASSTTDYLIRVYGDEDT